MSQSFTWINFSKREYLNPVPFKNDVKWPCFHHVGAESTNAVLTLMADEWRVDVIDLVGDATGLEFYEHKNCPASMHRLLELTEGEGPWRYAALWFSDVSGRFKCAKGKVGRQRVGEGEGAHLEKLPFDGTFDKDIVIYPYIVNETTNEYYKRKSSHADVDPFSDLMMVHSPSFMGEDVGIWIGDDVHPAKEPPVGDYRDITDVYTVE